MHLLDVGLSLCKKENQHGLIKWIMNFYMRPSFP